MFNLQKINDLFFNETTVFDFFACGFPDIKCAACDPGFEMNVAAKPDVVQYAHTAKDFHFLKGPGHTQCGPRIWLEVVDTLSFIEDISALRAV